jgi:hypothetical protein
MLPKLKIATPCPADWNKMIGDDKVRFCSLCNLNVYNLSAMTEPEALKILQSRDGRLCARMYQRADGTVLTQDCPVGIRAAYRRMTRFATAVLAMIFAAPLLRGQSAPQSKDQLLELRPGETGLIVTVSDFTGAIIQGAIVRLTNGGKTIVEMRTHGDGMAHFGALAPSDYQMTVTSNGFRTMEKQVHVSPSAISNVEAKMVLAQDVEVWVGLIAEPPIVNVDTQQSESIVPLNSLPSAAVPATSNTPSKRSIK